MAFTDELLRKQNVGGIYVCYKHEVILLKVVDSACTLAANDMHQCQTAGSQVNEPMDKWSSEQASD
jgi:hypothetical protein